MGDSGLGNRFRARGIVLVDTAFASAECSPSAQWEIQVLVTETGHEVLCW